MVCECGNDHKYTCPACGILTCCVECSKRHKSVSGCTGILDPTRFIPKGELLTPTGLDRDYNFLQKMARDIQIEAPEFKRRARDLVRNNVKVRVMPPQMSRAKQNKSGWNRAKQCYLWTVEIKKELGKQGDILHVPDTQTVAEISGVDHPVLIDGDGKKVKLDGNHTLAEALKGQSVVEFPTIFVGELPESDSSDSSDSESDDSSESGSDSDSDSGDSVTITSTSTDPSSHHIIKETNESLDHEVEQEPAGKDSVVLIQELKPSNSSPNSPPQEESSKLGDATTPTFQDSSPLGEKDPHPLA